MVKKLVVFLAIFSVAFASTATLIVKKEGEKIELNMGANVKTWHRDYDGLGKQFARHCSLITNKDDCGKWIGTDGKVVANAGTYKIADDGTLTIEKATKSDAAIYSSPDFVIPTIEYPDGTTGPSSLAPMYGVEIEEKDH